MNFAHLLSPNNLEDLARRWLSEDQPGFDVGGYVVGDDLKEAHIYFKSSGVLCGVPFAEAICRVQGCDVEWHFKEGVEFSDSELIQDSGLRRKHIATVRGRCCDVLRVERTVLNVLSRASGVATQARAAVAIAKKEEWHGTIAGTRKTTPGFRSVEKYALIVGGASTHRQDLSQMVMLKDNHIWAMGSITGAVQRAKEAAGFSMKIEVECQSEDEALEAAVAGADIVMLDNFSPCDVGLVASNVKTKFPHILIEASGGITTEVMANFMHPSVDIISRGSLTQGYPCVDISMKLNR